MITSEGDCRVVCNRCFDEVGAASYADAVSAARAAGWHVSTAISLDLCASCQANPASVPLVLAELERVG